MARASHQQIPHLCNILLVVAARMAQGELKEVPGLFRLCDWIKSKGIRRVAVTNAPRKNAEQMINALGLSSFFEDLIIGAECERAKPFPDPYLKGLISLGVSADEAFVFEVCLLVCIWTV